MPTITVDSRGKMIVSGGNAADFAHMLPKKKPFKPVLEKLKGPFMFSEMDCRTLMGDANGKILMHKSGQPLSMPQHGAILLTKPVNELVAHIFSFKLPTFQLVARAVKALASVFFRWHLCDNVLLYTTQGIVHSLKGKVEIQSQSEFNKQFPFYYEKARWLALKDRSQQSTYNPANTHSFFDTENGIRCPDFKKYTKIDAQSAFDYYYDFFNIELTAKLEGNTIYTLLKSA